MSSKRILLITGEPGVGKTTLIQKLYSELSKQLGKSIGGFYTEEVRGSAGRIGFDVVTLGPDSVRTELARKGGQSTHFIGSYAVFTDKLEQAVLPILEDVNNYQLIIIDEIGKMELKSRHFSQVMSFIFESPKNPVIVATVPLKSGPGLKLVDTIKANPDADIYTVTVQNRSSLFKTVLNHVKSQL